MEDPHPHLIAISAHRKGRVVNPMGWCPGRALGQSLQEAGPLCVQALHTCPGLSLALHPDSSELPGSSRQSLSTLPPYPSSSSVCNPAGEGLLQNPLHLGVLEKEPEHRASVYWEGGALPRYTRFAMCVQDRIAAQTQSTAPGQCNRAASCPQGPLYLLCSPREGSKSHLWHGFSHPEAPSQGSTTFGWLKTSSACPLLPWGHLRGIFCLFVFLFLFCGL